MTVDSLMSSFDIAASESDSKEAFDFLHLIHVERLGRWPVDHGAGDDVKLGAVALTHDRRSGQQAPGEWARLRSACAKVIEGVQATLSARNRDA